MAAFAGADANGMLDAAEAGKYSEICTGSGAGNPWLGCGIGIIRTP